MRSPSRTSTAKGVNRVILATDGDFNVGITEPDELKGFVERERGKGVFLSVLGFGMGNYNDALMQTLAQNGNGTAAYIDTLSEARKTLVEEATSTLFPIAKDVKIQIEFNPRPSPNTGWSDTRRGCCSARTSTTTRSMPAMSARARR
jgi:secreted protein with Ig-like and vWFA domain